MPYSYDDTTKTYTIVPKQDVTVEVGDSKQASFIPQIKVIRYGNDVNLSLRLIDTDIDIPQISLDGNTIKWIKQNIEAHFYELPVASNLVEGASEFGIYLNKKPSSNVIQFSIEAKNVRLHYQPSLVDEYEGKTHDEFGREIASVTDNLVMSTGGDVIDNRPEEIVGSYAIYSLGGKFSRPKKIGHLFSPLITDSDNKSIRGDYSIDGNILSITIPQSFLAQAKYPVFVDPSFGYDTQGGSSFSTPGNYSLAFASYEAACSGNIETIKAYLSASPTQTVYSAPYQSDGSGKGPSTRIVVYVGVSISSAGWYTFNISDTAITQNDLLYFALFSAAGDAFNTYYDSVDDTGWTTEGGYCYKAGNLSNPFGSFNVSGNQRMGSIYAEASGSEADEPLMGNFMPNGTVYATDDIIWNKFVAPADMSVDEVTVLVNNAEGAINHVIAAIYDHDSGNNTPENLLGTGTTTEIPASGLYDIAVPFGTPVSLTQGNTYWLAFQFDDGTNCSFRYETGAGQYYRKDYSYGAFPDPAPDSGYDSATDLRVTVFCQGTISGTTAPPTTLAPTTLAPTTLAPTTAAPTTLAPTTLAPTTLAPTTLPPTTLAPTTLPTTAPPTTLQPTTTPPTTKPPTTAPPTTLAPTTLAPTTLPPTTLAPTTLPPTTLAPTTLAPTTLPPTTLQPTTTPPTTKPPTTTPPTTVAPTTEAPTTAAPTTLAPTTLPTTAPPTTLAPTTIAPTTLPPTTLAPTTLPPTTLAPTTLPPTTVAPTTIVTTAAPTTTLTTAAPTTFLTTLAPTTVEPYYGDWRNLKGFGDWGFEEAPDKWGYLNNPWWHPTADGDVVSYSGRENEEPQIFPIPSNRDRSFKGGVQHVPCGHWHKRRGAGIPITKIYAVASDTTGTPTAFGYIINIEDMSLMHRVVYDTNVVGNWPANDEGKLRWDTGLERFVIAGERAGCTYIYEIDKDYMEIVRKVAAGTCITGLDSIDYMVKNSWLWIYQPPDPNQGTTWLPVDSDAEYVITPWGVGTLKHLGGPQYEVLHYNGLYYCLSGDTANHKGPLLNRTTLQASVRTENRFAFPTLYENALYAMDVYVTRGFHQLDLATTTSIGNYACGNLYQGRPKCYDGFAYFCNVDTGTGRYFIYKVDLGTFLLDASFNNPSDYGLTNVLLGVDGYIYASGYDYILQLDTDLNLVNTHPLPYVRGDGLEQGQTVDGNWWLICNYAGERIAKVGPIGANSMSLAGLTQVLDGTASDKFVCVTS